MTDVRQDDQRLLEELQRAAELLYRQGCGDGAAAVDEAIRRLRPTRDEAA